MKKPVSSLMKTSAALLLATFLLHGACSGSNTPPPPPESPVLFQSLGVNVILPTYDDLVAQTTMLADTVNSFCAAPSDPGLAEAQDAWRRTRGPLKRSEAFLFGPVKDLGINQAIDFWPTRPNNIEDAIAGDGDFDQAFVESLGTSAKGLPAIEYLLFDPVGGNAAILARLTDPTTGAHRCDYLSALAVNVQSQAQTLRDAWDSDDGAFLQNLIEAGDSKPYPNVSMAISDFVNSMIFLSEAVQGTKLGGPLGKKTGGNPSPSSAESFFSDNSLEDIISNLEGLKSLYLAQYGGQDGLGFDDYIRSKDPVLADEITLQIDAALDAVRSIPPPLTTAVELNSGPVEAAYNEVRQVQVLLESQFASLLGATVTFNDNDGD